MDKIKQWPVPPIPDSVLEIMNLMIDNQMLALHPSYEILRPKFADLNQSDK